MLERFSPTTRAAALECLLKMRPVSVPVQRVVGQFLAAELQRDAGEPGKAANLEKVSDLCASLGSSSSREFILRLDADEPEVANIIRRGLFAFEDLLLLQPRDLARVIESSSIDILVRALVGTEVELCGRVLAVLPGRTRRMVEQELLSSSGVSSADVESARSSISASVIIKTHLESSAAPVSAIRRIVAGAIPGLAAEQVSVVGDDGVVLGGAPEVGDSVANQLWNLERAVAADIRDNIIRTLSSQFGNGNVKANVVTRLNIDKKQTNETVFNPDSRVERSVRTVKESQNSQNANGAAPVTVERNLPQDRQRPGDSRQNIEENAKREETTRPC